MSNINKNEIPIQNNNSKEEIKEGIEIQQNKNSNKKKNKKKTNQKDLEEISNNNNNNTNQNNNIIKENEQKNKENIKLIIKEQNDLLTKEREYLKTIENLKLKIKNLEQSNNNELNKLSIENNEKENSIQILSSTNKKMKQSFDMLIQRMEQLEKKNNNEQSQKISSKNAKISEKNEKISEKNEKENELKKKKKEIKEKQKKIDILSKENENIKKSIDRFYELDINKHILTELKNKEYLKKQLEEEIKKYKPIVEEHNACLSKINNLEKELYDIQNQLDLKNIEFHDKNKDYLLLKSKISLYNEQNIEVYMKFRNKKNFLDMKKHNDFLNYNNQQSDNLKMINRKKEFSRDLEKGIKKNYERSISLPKIDVNTEKKVISSLFTEEELIYIENLIYEKYQDENKLKSFMNKINELEKGNDVEKTTVDDLNEECLELEKEINENDELIKIQEFKLKEKYVEISELNKKYRNLLKKNLLLKKEENKLKNDLKEKNKKNLIKIKKDKQKQEIDSMINDINKINYKEEDLLGSNKNSSNNFSNDEYNNDVNINNEELQNKNEEYEDGNNKYNNYGEKGEEGEEGEEGEREEEQGGEGEDEGEGEGEGD